MPDTITKDKPLETALENNRTARLLMCAPTAYALKYVINPWMKLENAPDLKRAAQQWKELHRTLTEDMGATVKLVPQAENCPDMVFTANAALIRGRTAVLANFKHPERQVEAPHYHRWLESNGFEVLTLPQDCNFEGEGDALFVGETLLAGYARRSDFSSHQIVSEALSVPVLSLRLTDDRWYHLDTCLFPLDAETVVFYPGAFDAASADAVRSRFQTIEITETEALRFACNAVRIGKTVALPSGCPLLTAELESRGDTVYAVEMSEFLKAGGAAKCLTLFLSNP